MSYTNQTANYGLPQYTADDKPTYLGDFNKAMLDIDTAIKANENIATASQTLAQNANNSASEALSTANTASSSATNAGVRADNAYALAESAKADANQATTDATDAKTIANSANQTATSANATATSAQTTATNANNTATSAQTTANSANTKAEQALELLDLFNFTNFRDYSASDLTLVNCTSPTCNLHVATNSDGSIGKIYGRFGFANTNQGSETSVKIPSALRPASKITIDAICVSGAISANVFSATVDTDGTISFINESGLSGEYRFYVPPCLYFMKDFEDTTPSA